MGKGLSTHIDVRNRHPFCPALSYDEWDRLVEKVGLEATIELGFRTSERDRLLRTGKKSVPKHRKSAQGPSWP
jgi:hypothetical protein